MKKEHFKKLGCAFLAALLTSSMLFTSACSDNSEDTNAPWTTEEPETIPWTTDDIESNIVYEDTEPVEDVTDTFETNTPETDAPETLFGPGYELSDGTLTILDDDAMVNYDDPQQIPWYGQRESITKVIISDGVTRIGSLAFFQCSNLESITIPDSVKSIEENAFNNCTALKSVKIPSGVEKINDWTFSDCASLSSIEIPTSVTHIGEFAFDKCKSLTKIVIPNSVEVIDGYAFYLSGLESITLPDSLKSIGSSAFVGCCESLTSLTIPAKLEKLAINAFDDCHNLTKITVDKNNKYFSNDERGVLFNKDKTTLIWYPEGNNSTEYTIPNSVTAITVVAFEKSHLKSIVIPGSVKTIGAGAFIDSSDLAKVTLFDGVTFIEEDAFCGCTNLESIVLPDSVTSIGEGAFYASGLKSFEIPNGITTIKRRTFRNCPNLESIEIPSSVKSIEEEVFWNCESLKELKIPRSVTEFDTSAIIWCVSLEAITVDENNKNFSSVDGVLFNKDKTVLLSHPQGSKRTEYTVPDSVQAIDKDAFEMCENLKGVEIPASVKSLSFPVFHICENLETVTVDENNKYFSSIDGVLFNKDKTVLLYYPQGSKRTEYTVPDCVKTIGEEAFGDSLLKSVIISDGVTDIGSFAFEWCESLEQIEIPTSVKSISYAVFSMCNSLKEINFKGTKAQWEAIEKDEVWDLYMPEYTVNFGA